MDVVWPVNWSPRAVRRWRRSRISRGSFSSFKNMSRETWPSSTKLSLVSFSVNLVVTFSKLLMLCVKSTIHRYASYCLVFHNCTVQWIALISEFAHTGLGILVPRRSLQNIFHGPAFVYTGLEFSVSASPVAKQFTVENSFVHVEVSPDPQGSRHLFLHGRS